MSFCFAGSNPVIPPILVHGGWGGIGLRREEIILKQGVIYLIKGYKICRYVVQSVQGL